MCAAQAVGLDHDNDTVIRRNTRRCHDTRSLDQRQRPAGTVHRVVTGEITHVDRNSGKVDIRSSDGSKVQVILPPLAVATTNKGDRASIDVTIGPAR